MHRALLVVGLLASCAPARFVGVGPPGTAAPTRIERVQLQWSNVYLLRRGGALAVVDTGSPADRDKLYDALVAAGAHPRDVRVAIVTHAHADHAGQARWLQLYGARVVLGAGDVAMAAAGENLPLRATSLFASAIAPMFMVPFDPFTPDLAVDKEIDLAPFGFPDVRVIHMPGHTAGSVVVIVGGKEALVGDMILGGWFGGALKPHQAGEHYYQADRRANRQNVARVLALGAERFYPGHGGPIPRASVERWAR